jgi:hypothetical protein
VLVAASLRWFCLLTFAAARAWMTAHWGVWRSLERSFLPGPGDTIYWSPGWALVGAVALVLVVPPGLAYWLTATRVSRGIVSLSISSRLALSSAATTESPVMFPSGCRICHWSIATGRN